MSDPEDPPGKLDGGGGGMESKEADGGSGSGSHSMCQILSHSATASLLSLFPPWTCTSKVSGAGQRKPVAGGGGLTEV